MVFLEWSILGEANKVHYGKCGSGVLNSISRKMCLNSKKSFNTIFIADTSPVNHIKNPTSGNK